MTMKEKYGEQLSRMQKGKEDALSVFEELFLFACPKYISPAPTSLETVKAVAVVRLEMKQTLLTTYTLV
jgi:RNA polymerase I-associated factor PAF67